MENIFSPLVLKALHLIFMVTWFAALFYIVRLFVYHAEAAQKPEPDRSILIRQYQLMQWRLWYIIGWPSMVLTLIFGIGMLIKNPGFLTLPFMHVKLGLVTLLVIYHFYCQRLLTRLQHNDLPLGTMGFRILNEVATLLLIAIVFVIVLRDSISWLYGMLGIMGVALLMMLAIKLYKKARNKNENNA
jgi:protoporphyrinogen IX oxidase